MAPAGCAWPAATNRSNRDLTDLHYLLETPARHAAEDILASRVRALMARLADKDEYTERHTRRVAQRAVQVGKELGLSSNSLRVLAIGALVHDVGKLSVPERILKKRGALDGDEYGEIKKHPITGERLLSELGGFPASVRRLVRDHHERLDGSGYPYGLTAPDLDLETRILTVCDVYDALVSTRVYRPAWTHEQAIALLENEAGVAFDARCVAALERITSAPPQPTTRERPHHLTATAPALLERRAA
jgi:HD-GYP domain-containing protein (c-di-GMP phosphodiesterase class II)